MLQFPLPLPDDCARSVYSVMQAPPHDSMMPSLSSLLDDATGKFWCVHIVGFVDVTDEIVDSHGGFGEVVGHFLVLGSVV